jgi:hypothetical protein
VRPYPDELLSIIQRGVMAHFGPEVASDYGKAQIAFSMILFMVAERDYDTAVPDLVEANAQLRALLRDAEAELAQMEGSAASEGRAAIAAIPAPAATLRLSDLRAEHDGLRTAVCILTPLIEPAAEDASLAPLRDVRAAAFAWLAADAKRRSVPILNA